MALASPIALPSGDVVTFLLTGWPYTSGASDELWLLTGLVARVETPGRAPRLAGSIDESIIGWNVAVHSGGWDLVTPAWAVPLGGDALVIGFQVGLCGNSGASAVFVLSTTPSPRLSLAYVDPVFGWFAGPTGRVRVVTYAERHYVSHATRDTRKQLEEVSVTGRMRRVGRWPLPAGLGTEWTEVPPLDWAWTAARWMPEAAEGDEQGEGEQSSVFPY